MQFDGLRWRDKGKYKSLWTPKDLNKNTTLKKIINIDTSWLKEDLPTERISNLMASQKGINNPRKKDLFRDKRKICGYNIVCGHR